MTEIIAAGIDLGGTKVEVSVFDTAWHAVGARRLPTPDSYATLLETLDDLAKWADTKAGIPLPLGLGAAGVVHPVTGRVTAANLGSDGQNLGADVSTALERHVVMLNDSAALALSEAHFGAGRDARRMLALVIGTGVSAASVVDGVLQSGFSGTLGEVGHIASPAHLVKKHTLPMVETAGQTGAIETLISGTGLSRVAEAVTGLKMMPEEIVVGKKDDEGLARVWAIWCDLVADLLRTLVRTNDPDCIVLGGGLSSVSGVAEDLTAALTPLQFTGFPVPRIVVAEGGAASGARGAAYAAWQATQ